MRDYHCPRCGRFLLATDAADGAKIRLPRCPGCPERPLLTCGRDATAGEPAERPLDKSRPVGLVLR